MSLVSLIISVGRLMQRLCYQRVFNTIKLYAKQRRLITLVTDQIYEKEKKQPYDGRHFKPDHGVSKRRERTACIGISIF